MVMFILKNNQTLIKKANSVLMSEQTYVPFAKDDSFSKRSTFQTFYFLRKPKT